MMSKEPRATLDRLLYLLLFLFLIQCSASDPTIHDNTLLGDPAVECAGDSILVSLRTSQPFLGRLYVEGESDAPGCSLPGPESAFRIKFGDCNMRRQRTLNPRGVTYSLTVVASFHPLFVTGLDRAFNVRCFFTEAVKAIESALDVAQLTTRIVEAEFQLPHCSYQLQQGFGGPVIRFASVGDHVTHVFACDPLASAVYGVLIHSCYVDDGHGNRFALLDDRGCAIDKFLLNDLVYDHSAMAAHVDSRVFKYADRVQLFFTCTVQLCFRNDGGCDGITPPLCSAAPPHILGHRPQGLQHPLPEFPSFVQFSHPKPPGFSEPGPENLHEVLGSSLQEERRHPPGPPGIIPFESSNSRPISDAFGPAIISSYGFKDSPLTNETVEESNSSTTSRQSREARSMESDLSVELMVMPLEDSRPPATSTTTPSFQDFTSQSPITSRDAGKTTSSIICMSPATIAITTIGSLSGILIASLVTAIVVMRRLSRSSECFSLRQNGKKPYPPVFVP